jgi:hypothetical protein
MNAPSAISPREITFEKPVELYRTIRRRHFSRQMRRPCLAFLPIGVIGLLGVLLHLQRGESGGGYWLLICTSILPFAIWAAHNWATSQIRAAGPAPRYTVRVELESITITSEKASSTLNWSAITTMWKYPDMIFIFWHKKTDIDHAFALPTASLGEDLSRFIEDRVREHGGVVA